MQADLALRDGASATMNSSVHCARSGRASARHACRQPAAGIGTRGRQGPFGSGPRALHLAALTIEVVQDCLPRALDKSIDLGYEGLPSGDGAERLASNPTCSRS